MTTSPNPQRPDARVVPCRELDRSAAVWYFGRGEHVEYRNHPDYKGLPIEWTQVTREVLAQSAVNHQFRLCLPAAPAVAPASAVADRIRALRKLAEESVDGVLWIKTKDGISHSLYPSQIVALCDAAISAPPAQKIVAWWNGLSDGESSIVLTGEDTNHDIPLIAGVNPCNAAQPAQAVTDRKDK